MSNHEVLEHQPQENGAEQEALTCPTCGFALVPVWTLPKEETKFLQAVEIREQFYCKPCDTRFALEEILLPRIEKTEPKEETGRPEDEEPF
jgi:hypothetical protein